MSAVPPGPPVPPAASSRDVLLVEDHADTATVITLLLKKFGHRVRAVASVGDGIASFDAGRFDIILSDIGLPDGTGMDFIRQIRARSPVPAIALTGYGMEEDVRQCHEAGFNGHLTKPVNFAELDAMIRRLTTPAAGAA